MRVSMLHRPMQLPFLAGRPRPKDWMFFCRQLSVLLGAGITVLQALEILAEQVEHPSLREKLRQSARRVEEGHALADTFRSHGSFFPPYLVNMVEAGETGGTLEAVMERLAEHFERQHLLEQKLKTATTYPKLILGVVAAVLVFLLTAVLPSFAAIFDRMGVEMPALTRVLIGLGVWLADNGPVLLPLALLLVVLFHSLRRTGRGARLYDALRLYLPLYAPVYRKVLVARFSRALGTLLSSGVRLLDALEIAQRVTGNFIMGRSIEGARDGAAQGRALAESLAGQPLFPPLMLEMIRVGEHSGTLDEMLLRSAEFYEAEVSYEVERMSITLEPALIIAMALVIGFIILSVMMPLMEIYQLF